MILLFFRDVFEHCAGDHPCYMEVRIDSLMSGYFFISPCQDIDLDQVPEYELGAIFRKLAPPREEHQPELPDLLDLFELAEFPENVEDIYQGHM